MVFSVSILQARRKLRAAWSLFCSHQQYSNYVQVPLDILLLVASQLCLRDRASLCLTCKRLRRATRSVPKRVHLYSANWTAAAQQLRQTWPQVNIVVNVDEDGELAELVESPACDTISIAPQAELMAQWTFEPFCRYISGSSKQTLRRLQKAQQQLQAYGDVKKLEFILLLRSDQTGLAKMQNAIIDVAPAISHLRVKESLTECAKNILPLSNLHTLGFTLPYKFSELQAMQAAVDQLPSLTALHVYTSTANATSLLPRFLQSLLRLERLTSLRVVTSGHACCLVATSLQHVTALELGQRVTLDHLPNKLAHLRLQDAHDGFEPDTTVFQHILHLEVPCSLGLDIFTHSALQQLPTTLQDLSLWQRFDEEHLDSLCEALGRLSCLKALRIHFFE